MQLFGTVLQLIGIVCACIGAFLLFRWLGLWCPGSGSSPLASSSSACRVRPDVRSEAPRRPRPRLGAVGGR